MVEAIRQGDIPGVQLRYRQPLSLPVVEVWEWLTTPSLLERWLCARATVELDADGGLALESPREGAALLRELGETLELEAPRLWSLAFRQLESDWQTATRLTLELHQIPTGCELDVFHEGFEHLSLSTCLTVWEEYRRRWRKACSALAAAAEPPA